MVYREKNVSFDYSRWITDEWVCNHWHVYSLNPYSLRLVSVIIRWIVRTSQGFRLGIDDDTVITVVRLRLPDVRISPDKYKIWTWGRVLVHTDFHNRIYTNYEEFTDFGEKSLFSLYCCENIWKPGNRQVWGYTRPLL